MRTMKHWALAVMTAAALALAGCGGGGGSSPKASGPTPAQQQHTTVSAAITAAETAVDGLTDMSTDEDVAAAETAIAAARTALNGASLLSANEVNALDNSLDAIDDNLVMAKADIAEHRRMVAEEMTNQRMAADNAIETAMTAVGGLSNTSTDADVMAAKDAIQAAKDAVAAATALSMADRDSLTARISMIETTLASTESNIADHRQMVADDNQRMAVSDAIDAAMAAVGDLSETSTDEEVNAAKTLIEAAETALSGATSVLTAEKALELSGRITTIKGTLATTETAIAAHRQQEADDAETQRVADVSAARMAAMQSYMAAAADATEAETAADAAEETSPGSPGAMAAREAATAARAAADAARAAHDAIMDDMTKEQADAEAAKAATEAGKADTQNMIAMRHNNDIQTAAATSAEQQRVRDVAAAKEAASDAVEAAETAKNNAATAATAAEQARDDAHAAYMRAISARTDSTNAKAEYEKAKAAATAARTAADTAETAYMAAKMAADGIMDDDTTLAAQTAQGTAEDEQANAETAAGTADTQKMTAETAETAAMAAANKHVVGLLMLANAVHITTAADPDANRDETEIGLIEKNRLAHVKVVNTAVSTANADNPVATTPTSPYHDSASLTASVDVTASWQYYGNLGTDGIISDAAAVTSDATNADTKPGEGLPMISLTVPGSTDALELVHDDAATEDTDETNFEQGPGLGAFSHEKYFGRYNDADTSGTVNGGDSYQRIILFTDLTQAKATVPAESVSLTNEPVSMASRVTPTAAPATTGEDIHDFAGTYDHDGNPDTAPIAGTFDCVDPTTCRVQRSGTGNNGEHVTGQTKVTSISGYRFTGTGTTAEVLSKLDDTWLAFGVWLTETVVDNGVNTYAFGAFADGGAAVGANGEPSAVDSVTGNATYTGKAAGVHSTATEVEFFHADATFNAKFGDGTEIGTITGMIHNIMSGGRPVGDNIELVVADPGATSLTPNILTGGTFSGRARMTDTGRDDDSGEDIYRMTGGWSGTFYNHMADDTTTTPLDESTRAPGSVAGTFGVGRADDTTTMDVDETESYVGAFGAHCSGSNCNPHD